LLLPRDIRASVTVDERIGSDKPNKHIVNSEIVQHLAVNFEIGRRARICRERFERVHVSVNDHDRHADEASSSFRGCLPDRRLIPIRFEMPNIFGAKLKMHFNQPAHLRIERLVFTQCPDIKCLQVGPGFRIKSRTGESFTLPA
jgi:hypothetical protein